MQMWETGHPVSTESYMKTNDITFSVIHNSRDTGKQTKLILSGN